MKEEKKGGSMRDRMPQCAAFIDDLRQAFSVAEVDGWIRSGMARGRFYAEEGEHVIGAPIPWGRPGGSEVPALPVTRKHDR